MKKLTIFNLFYGTLTTDLSEKANAWYLKNYECYFDEVNNVSLTHHHETVHNGRSSFVFLGKNSNKINFILAPFRLWKYARKTGATHFITYEQVWVWWIGFMVKFFLRKKIYMAPMTYPEQMYKVSGKSLSYKYPIWLERILLKMSYRFCSAVVTAKGAGNFINWLQENKTIRKKLIIVDTLPETVAYPSFMETFRALHKKYEVRLKTDEPYKLIYVGRFMPEKLVDHLIRALGILQSRHINAELTLIGFGPEKDNLLALARELGVEKKLVVYSEYMPNGEIPPYLMEADLFVSPLTGGSFREAAIVGLPIIAYNIDWLKGFVVHREHFYGVEEVNPEKFAAGIEELLADKELREKLSGNAMKLAKEYWSPEKVGPALQQIFG